MVYRHGGRVAHPVSGTEKRNQGPIPRRSRACGSHWNSDRYYYPQLHRRGCRRSKFREFSFQSCDIDPPGGLGDQGVAGKTGPYRIRGFTDELAGRKDRTEVLIGGYYVLLDLRKCTLAAFELLQSLRCPKREGQAGTIEQPVRV